MIPLHVSREQTRVDGQIINGRLVFHHFSHFVIYKKFLVTQVS